MFNEVPSLALYRPHDQNVRKSALEICRQSLEAYSSIEEGIRAVDRYLNDEPQKYVVPMGECLENVPDILKRSASYDVTKN
ncbi:unnamed protein product [marine sediment metagenome]|uniref:Uncharacterized protein n=1 Tax=marine sediment metagenome TaxID=412755 RepID=X1SK10_9ZZZZ